MACDCSMRALPTRSNAFATCNLLPPAEVKQARVSAVELKRSPDATSDSGPGRDCACRRASRPGLPAAKFLLCSMTRSTCWAGAGCCLIGIIAATRLEHPDAQADDGNVRFNYRTGSRSGASGGLGMSAGFRTPDAKVFVDSLPGRPCNHRMLDEQYVTERSTSADRARQRPDGLYEARQVPGSIDVCWSAISRAPCALSRALSPDRGSSGQEPSSDRPLRTSASSRQRRLPLLGEVAAARPSARQARTRPPRRHRVHGQQLG